MPGAMNVHTDRLVDHYLHRLDAAASALPAHQRDELVSEIRDHPQEALRQIPAGDKAVLNVLERLGTPEKIAAADPPGWPDAAFSLINGLAIEAPGRTAVDQDRFVLQGAFHYRRHCRLTKCRMRHPYDIG